MWIEKTPEVGDTVKVSFADFTKIPDSVGIVLRTNNGVHVDFGHITRILSVYSGFMVWVSE